MIVKLLVLKNFVMLPPNSLFLKMFYYLSNISVMYPPATQSSIIIKSINDAKK